MSRLWLLATLTLCTLACSGASTQAWNAADRGASADQPSALRPGYGNRDLHLWWPASGAEVGALQGLGAAQAGDPQALLALAIVTSGQGRDAAAYRAYASKIAAFVAANRAAVLGAADPWHQGYELLRTMHRDLLGGIRSDLGDYVLTQNSLPALLDSGRYNCVSSAILFAILARHFGMSVRGVSVPTHAFIELGARGAKVLEVETTSPTGFDWVHDARFFAEEAAHWSNSRGLAPVTLADYQQRQIVEPWQLIAANIVTTHNLDGKSEAEQQRLYEWRGFLEPHDPTALLDRLRVYHNEARTLFAQGAWNTVVRLAETVQPVLNDAATRFGRDPKLMRFVLWTRWHQAASLAAIGRGQEAVELADASLAQLSPAIEGADGLRGNFLAVLMQRMQALMQAGQFAEALQVPQRHLGLCQADPTCAGNLQVVTHNWMVSFENRAVQAYNAGDWLTARTVLQQCLAAIPDAAPCSQRLQELESRHRF